MKFEFILALIIIFNIFIFLKFEKIKFLNKILDKPDNFRKKHSIPTPLAGGIILFINIIMIIILSPKNFFYSINLFDNYYNLITFTLILSIIFLIGIFDDIRELNPNLKLLLLSISILLLLFFDDSLLIQSLKFSFFREIYLENTSLFFTTLCFLLFINALNMFDGINLQTASFIIIVALYLIIKGIFVFFLILLLIPLINYSLLNYKNKTFLGDGGTYLLSFLFSYLFVKSYNLNLINVSDEIFVCMMIPGIDMFRLFIERILKKKSPFKPDRNHLHHILQNKFGYIRTILIIISLILTSLILLMLNVNILLIIILYLVIYCFIIFKFRKLNS